MFVPKYNVYTRSKVAFDITNQRVASDAVIQHGRRVFHIKAIVNFATKKHYLIFKIKNKRVCRVHRIKKSLPPRPNCLPSGFKSLGAYVIGSGKESLNQHAYGLFKRNYQNVISVTDSCIPVRDSVFFKNPKKGSKNDMIYASASWYNIKAGIRDTSVFNVPKECNKHEELTVLDHLKSINMPEEMFEKALVKVKDNIKKFEKSYEYGAIHQMPHGSMRAVHASMNNLVANVMQQIKKMKTHSQTGDLVNDLFAKL